MLSRTTGDPEHERAAPAAVPQRGATRDAGGVPGLSPLNRPSFPSLPPLQLSAAGGEVVRRECDECKEEREQKVMLAAAPSGGAVGAEGPPASGSGSSAVPVGAATDPLEREADQAAAQVMRAPAPEAPAQIPRGATGATYAAGATGSYLRNLNGGAPLTQEARTFFEPRFGRPLDHVRIHTDARAGEAARGLGAKAFAYGTHIGFAPGRFDPVRTEGKRLLAHEIAHVLQQPQHVSRQPDPQTPPTATEDPGLAAGAEPILPTAVGAGGLREEAQTILTEDLNTAVSDPQQRAQVQSNATYIIVGERLSWYRADGRLIRAFALAPGVSTWAAGIYFRTVEDQVFRYIRMGGAPAFAPWIWSNAHVGLIVNWLRPQDVQRFQEVISGYGGAPVMIMIPSDPAATRRDARRAQQLVEQVQQRMRDRAAAAASAATQPTPSPDSQTPPAPQTPQQRVGDPPDQVTVWSNERGVYVNVTVDRARTSLEVDDNETVDGLEQRIQEAADDLRAARDPLQSSSIAGGATSTGFADRTQPSPRFSNPIANAPAYPATIRNYGPDTTVPGAIGHFEMQLDYSLAGSDTLSQVAARMQHINYYWELLDVTNLNPAQLADAPNRIVGSGERASNLEAFQRDLQVAGANVVEDTAADLSDLSRSWLPVPVKANWLAVIGISNVVRLVGAPISSLITTISQPFNEQRLSFSYPGDFLVRCVATPAHAEGDQLTRASSVATTLVRVEEIHTRASGIADSTERQIAQLEAQRAAADTDAARAALDTQIQALQHSLTATTAELGGDALRLVNQRLAVALALDTAIASGTRTQDRSPEARLLAVQLELQNIPLADYLQSLRDQKTEIEGRLALTSRVGGQMPLGNYHPRVVLVSEETGQTYDVLTVLGEAADSSEGHRHYLLADVSNPHPAERYIYEGRSESAGVTGHSEAIRQAFVDFRENNGYGRGTIAIRLPSTLNTAAGGQVQVDTEMRSAPGERRRVMQRLSDLATAAEVAGLFVGGPVGLAVGAIGGVAGAVVAIDSILRRREGTEFSWLSFQTIMDISSIVAGVVGVVGVGLLPLRNLPRWASRVERLQGILHIFGVTQMGAQVIVIPVQLEHDLEEIEQTRGITDGERDARRAEAFLRAVRSGIVTTVSAAQMVDAAHGEDSPRPAGDLAEHPTVTDQTPGTREGTTTTGDRPPETREGATTTGEHPVGEPAATPAPSARVVELESHLGDLQGHVHVVETDLAGRSTRVAYRDGEVRIEVGEGAGPREIQAHLETARTLLGYQTPLGRLRSLVSRILQVITGIPGHGSQGFESRLEVRKLNQMIETLRQQERAAQQRIETVGGREGPLPAAELERVQRDIADLEFQLQYHENLVNSLDPGSGHVAAYDNATRTAYPTIELDTIEAALRATSDESLTSVVTRMAELERQGRVTGLGDWIHETSVQAGDRTMLRARLAELGQALSRAEALPPNERLRLDPAGTAGSRTFNSVPETISSGARVPGANETALRSRFAAADLPAFDSLMQRRLAAAGGDTAVFDANLAKTPEAVIRRDVATESTRLAERAQLVRHAATLADPLNPQVSENLPPNPSGPNGDVWLHYERPATGLGYDPVEVGQANRLHTATGEEIHVFGKDPMGRDFGGIDGTIGDPRRPMQLKRVTSADPPSGVRLKAQEALQAARTSTLSGVEVYIEATAFTKAAVEADWGSPTVGRAPRGALIPSGAVFDGGIIGRIEISCSDGRMHVTFDGTNYTFHPI